jgi:hypothetical protein
MTCVPIGLISWDWITDVRSIVVGVIAGAMGGIICGAWLMRWWDRVTWRKELDARMSKMEGGLNSLDTSLKSKIEGFEGRVDGKFIALESQGVSLRSIQEAHRSENKTQYDSLIQAINETRTTLNDLRDLRNLRTEIPALVGARVAEELNVHTKSCGESVINPLDERLRVLEGVA